MPFVMHGLPQMSFFCMHLDLELEHGAGESNRAVLLSSLEAVLSDLLALSPRTAV
jgi:hypothetical protein